VSATAGSGSDGDDDPQPKAKSSVPAAIRIDLNASMSASSAGSWRSAESEDAVALMSQQHDKPPASRSMQGRPATTPGAIDVDFDQRRSSCL
jgi:hypothetical protein